MKKPLIGVLALFDEKKESYWMLPGYMEGILISGGLPVMLPLTDDEDNLKEICREFDGFLFTGGHDPSPSFYNEEPINSTVKPYPLRDKMESSLFRLVYGADKPILGICRGMQFSNVLLGGTLYQDLPSQRPGEISHHMSPPYDRSAHKVTVKADTPLYVLLGDLLENGSLGVNSYHHQAVKDLSPKLSVMAVSEDGLIEAVYDRSRKFLWGFQWHPEFSYKTDESSRRIFKEFVKASET